MLAKIGDEVRDTMITTADRLRAEGRAEGLLLRLLTARFGGLSSSVVERVERAAVVDIESWGERILTAATLAEV